MSMYMGVGQEHACQSGRRNRAKLGREGAGPFAALAEPCCMPLREALTTANDNGARALTKLCGATCGAHATGAWFMSFRVVVIHSMDHSVGGLLRPAHRPMKTVPRHVVGGILLCLCGRWGT